MIKYALNFLIIIFLTSSNAFAEESEVEKYVHTLITDSLTILNDNNLNTKMKSQKVRTMLSSNLDATWMGKFTLGRVVKTIDPAKLQQFLEASIYNISL